MEPVWRARRGTSATPQRYLPISSLSVTALKKALSLE